MMISRLLGADLGACYVVRLVRFQDVHPKNQANDKKYQAECILNPI